MPSLQRRPTNLTFIRGSPGLCPCLLDAHPPIQSVSWYRNGKSIRIEPKGTCQYWLLSSFVDEFLVVQLGGAYMVNTAYALLIKSADSDDGGQYFCRAQNSEGFGRDSLPIYIETKGRYSSI